LRFSPWQKKAELVKRVSLRRSRIIVDARRSVVFVDQELRGQDGKSSDELSFRVMKDKAGFVRALFLAAISTSNYDHMLPRDQLI